jgi:hypothetical protein
MSFGLGTFDAGGGVFPGLVVDDAVLDLRPDLGAQAGGLGRPGPDGRAGVALARRAARVRAPRPVRGALRGGRRRGRRSPAAAKQLASRARTRVRGSGADGHRDRASGRAASPGGRHGLPRSPAPTRWPASLSFSRLAPFAHPVLVDGGPGLITVVDGEVHSLQGLTPYRDRIVEIDPYTDRERLRHLARGHVVGSDAAHAVGESSPNATFVSPTETRQIRSAASVLRSGR